MTLGYREERERPRVVRILLGFVLLALFLAALGVGGFLWYAHQNRYIPEDTANLTLFGEPVSGEAQRDTPYRILTFNLGFCGMGAERDYYADGGEDTGAQSESEVRENLNAALAALDGAYDFLYIQELDIASERSFGINQLTAAQDRLSGRYMGAFAHNFVVNYLPLPLSEPTGAVESGLLTLSSVLTESARRYSLDVGEDFLDEAFGPAPCVMVTAVPAQDGKTLYLLNVQLSPVTDGADVREAQLAELRSLLDGYGGEYVILGGDFNQLLPDTPQRPAWWTDALPEWALTVPPNFAPEGYRWGADARTPSARQTDRPYAAGRSYAAVLDGFLVSPNIEIASVTALDLGFRHSDHNPVEMEFILR